MKVNIQLEEAQAILMNFDNFAQQDTVDLLLSPGRVLFQDIFAKINIPAFAKASVDGYAVITEDRIARIEVAPRKLKVLEEVRAGYLPKYEVITGTTIKIMTGTSIPKGANAVIKHEDVQRVGDEATVLIPQKVGANIIKMGEDVQKGELIAKKGTVISPALIALMAGLGQNRLPVFPEVKIAIISTGDELLDPSQDPAPGKIYNSNLYGLMARCSQLGVPPFNLGIVPDEIEVIADRITKGLAQADIVITTGGVSAGDYDVLQDVLGYLGAEILFTKIAIRPGSPMIAAVRDNKLIICLSGSPAAAMVIFDLLVVPLLQKMMGISYPFLDKIQGIFMDDFQKSSPQRRFIRAKLIRKDGVDMFWPTSKQGQGVLKSMVEYNVLLDIPAGSGPVISGQKVSGYIVGSLDHSYDE